MQHELSSEFSSAGMLLQYQIQEIFWWLFRLFLGLGVSSMIPTYKHRDGKRCKILGVLMNFSATHLQLIWKYVKSISRNIGSAIAPPVPPSLQLQWQLNLVNYQKSWLNHETFCLPSQFHITKSCSLFKSHFAFGNCRLLSCSLWKL